MAVRSPTAYTQSEIPISRLHTASPASLPWYPDALHKHAPVAQSTPCYRPSIEQTPPSRVTPVYESSIYPSRELRHLRSLMAELEHHSCESAIRVIQPTMQIYVTSAVSMSLLPSRNSRSLQSINVQFHRICIKMQQFICILTLSTWLAKSARFRLLEVSLD